MSDGPCCAHSRVIHKDNETGGRVTAEWWECSDCGTRFCPEREIASLTARLAEAEQERDSALNDRNNWRHHAVICSRPAKEINEQIAELSQAKKRIDGLEKFLPTADQVNALPEGIRRYVHDIVTICDESGIIAQNILTRDQNQQLEARVVELRIPTGSRSGK